jgi:hypothetical protein
MMGSFAQVLSPTPLCPDGHLPLKGGDQARRFRRSLSNVGDRRNQNGRLISPLEGEMSDRTEGGPLTAQRQRRETN